MAEPLIPSGYILLSRKIIDSEIFKKPPLYLKVWIYLLSKAQHSEYKQLIRGQLWTSIPEIQEACSWRVGFRKETPTKKQIYTILNWLRNPDERNNEQDMKETMIVTTKGTQGMLVFIENFNYYQNPKNYEGSNEGNDEKSTKELRTEQQGNNINKNEKNDKNKDYISVYDFYLTLNLKKHRAYTNDMAKAIKKAIKDNKYEIEYCKELLKRHETVVEKTKNLQYPVKARGFAEFFGQKVFGGTHLICSEYEEGGKYYEQYIKNSNQGNRIGVPPSESKLGKREEPWM